MKTFIRWSGNKSKYIKHIIPYIPASFDTYIEPFVGSGSVFLHLQPSKWIINDFNTDLITLWMCIKACPKNVLSKIKLVGERLKGLNVSEKRQYCSRITRKLSQMKHGCTRAIYFLLMKHFAYMGHIITNDKYIFPGFTNKPLHIMTERFEKNLLSIHEYLNSTNGTICNHDYKQVLKYAKENDFVFLDPPYIEDHIYQFSYNQGQTLNNKFLEELHEELVKLDKRRVKWLMTQADTKDVRRIFHKYNITSFVVFRRQSKTYKKELVIKNY